MHLKRIVLALVILSLSPFIHAQSTSIMPLSEVMPGMEGTWKTVVSGTEIETFKLKIIGVADNFVGPKQSVIIAEALDADQILSGPVSGMSGSPVYIGDRLIGAYAYGFLWPKEQAVIGITPIEEMLPILETPEETSSYDRPSPENWQPPVFSDPDSQFASHSQLKTPTAPTGGWNWQRIAKPFSDVKLNTVLKALPTPLLVSGVSSKTLEAFATEFKTRGLDVRQAPSGTSKRLENVDLLPGSAVACVLMDGDFSFSRVGTVTWREGDELLAFGHAMDQSGDISMPMAPAEIITIVRHYESSFKLSNVGQPVGAIHQDRLTGIAGRIGETAPTTPISITVNPPGKAPRTYSGNVFYDRALTPLIAAISLFESLTSTLDTGAEQTFFTDIKMSIQGHDDLHYREVISGFEGALTFARNFMSIYDALLNNPFESAEVEGVTIDVGIADEWRGSKLQSVQVLSGTPQGGDTIRFALVLDNYLSPSTRHIVEVPLPEKSENQKLQVLIADAATADTYDRGIFGPTLDSLAGIIDYVNESRTSQKLYIKLLKSSEGLQLKGRHLYDLPPSVRKLIDSSRSARANQSAIRLKTIWEKALTFESPVSGSYMVAVPLK